MVLSSAPNDLKLVIYLGKTMDGKEREIDQANQRLLSEFPETTYEQWKEEAVRLLKGAPFEKKLLTKTYEGIILQPLYRKEDLEKLDFADTLPGEKPFLRGVDALGFKRKPWEIAQEIPYADPGEFNEALLHDLKRGQTAVNLHLDRASRACKDADEAEMNHIGDGGLSVNVLEDLEIALKDVDLETTPIYTRPGGAALLLSSMIVALMKRKGQDISKLSGSIGFDPHCGLARFGGLSLPLDKAYDELAALTRWGMANAPDVKTLVVCGYPYHSGGASAVQELAYMLAGGVEVLREMEARGIGVNDVGPRIEFTTEVSGHFFMEVAKLRALRLLWSQVVEAAGGYEDSQKVTLHIRSSKVNKTQLDPYVNMLRGTTEAFSAIVGGADSIYTSPFDAVIRKPNEFSRRIARNTQLVLREESHLDNVVDPAGGSWFIESLTLQVSEQAWKLFRDIEAAGGMTAALKDGKPQADVAEMAVQREKNLATRKDVLVGTNQYSNMSEKIMQVEETVSEEFRQGRITRVKEKKQASGTVEILATLSDSGINFELIRDAFMQGATIGQVAAALGHFNGEHPSVEPVKPFRTAALFEELRLAVHKYNETSEKPATIYLANIGKLRMHKARADFSRGFFQVGGFEVVYPAGFEAPEEVAQAAINSGEKVFVLCGTDDIYESAVEIIAPTLKKANPDCTIILAGYPKDKVEDYKNAGVDEFIHVRANVYELLTRLADKLGVFS